ncbi:hypothetical protein PSYJA_47083, partial [Pseudomonas syringae pv. japonica str. M301072]
RKKRKIIATTDKASRIERQSEKITIDIKGLTA